ncbi:MAG: hypothetical protein J5661_04155 [Bacteroidaceae bacterium]|nr:hypothetical protein [Bacteroidaceae bacterium]
MKKIYSVPEMVEADLTEVTMLAASGAKGKIGDTNIIDYGGVDASGSKDPAVKQNNGWSDWDDE